MLIYFEVSNFRSIDEKGAKFSMLPSKGASRTLETGSAFIPQAMKLGAIFGANGAGKSNLVSAMKTMVQIIQRNASLNSTSPLPIDPFILCETTRGKPTKFEAQFAFKGAIWRYGFKYDLEGIFEEWLFKRNFSSRSLDREMFFRSRSETRFGKELRVHAKNLKERTPTNRLYLSKLDQDNVVETQPAFEWIVKYFRPVGNIADLGELISTNHLKEPKSKDRIIGFLRSTGVQLDDISVDQEERKIDIDDFLTSSFIRGRKPVFSINEETATRFDITFMHRDKQNTSVAFEFADESTGTQNLFSIAGPIIDTLKFGLTLVIDEINQTFHTDALLAIIDIFLSEEANSNDAQLIFTTHDISVMDHLERDEIWFVEKDSQGASELFSLSDVGTVREGGARRNEAFGKRYLEGRYGARPNIDVVMAIRKIQGD